MLSQASPFYLAATAGQYHQRAPHFASYFGRFLGAAALAASEDHRQSPMESNRRPAATIKSRSTRSSGLSCNSVVYTELWGIDGTIFRPNEHWDYRLRYQGIPMWVIPTIDFEKLYVRVLTNYVQVASSALKLDPPYTVELGALGLQEVYFTAPGLHGRGERKGPVKVEFFQRRYALSYTTDDAIKAVLGTYFTELYDLAAFARTEAFTSDVIAAHDLPSL
jgi:hypothetical protein